MKRILFALILFSVSGCEERLKPSVVPVEEGRIPSQESWLSTVTLTDSAKVKAVLWAGYIAVYTDRQQTIMKDSVHVDFYNTEEKHASVLTAKRGKVNDRTKDFAAYDSVVVVSDSGTVLKTDSLFWNNATRKVETNAFVEIISPTEHIKGHGLVSDQSLKDYRIFRVTGESVVREE